jgi:hypothetical protein
MVVTLTCVQKNELIIKKMNNFSTLLTF